MTIAWDETTRPSLGGSAVDDADARPIGRTTGAGGHLVAMHGHFRGELEQLRGVLEQVRTGAIGAAEARSQVNAMALRANTWVLGSFCQSFCFTITQHHTIEDTAVFTHLGSREAGLQPVLDRLGSEHVVIHHLLDAVDAELVALVTAPDDLTGLQAAVDDLTTKLLSHFDYEERELVGPLDRLGMSAPSW